jgi:vesicular inhibitory amino acid transporter
MHRKQQPLVLVSNSVPPRPSHLQLICKALDLMPPGQQKTYPELGRAAGGTPGMRILLCFSLLELFGGTVVLLMVCWQMLELLLPSEGIGPLHPPALAALITTAALLPALLCVELRRLSRLSVVGGASTAMVVCMVLALLVLDPRREAMPQQVNGWAGCWLLLLPLCLRSYLPAVRACMQTSW